jgi:hypothetical protein
MTSFRRGGIVADPWDAIRFWRGGFRKGTGIAGAATATVTGAESTATVLDGPPIARTDSVTLAPAERISKRKSTSL